MIAKAPPPPDKFPRVWIFDVNRRRYAPDGKGGPIWRHHWVEVKIIGETSRSWILAGGNKIPKKSANPMAVAWSTEEVEQRAWAHDHVHGIVDAVKRRVVQGDTKILDAIATRIGYTPRMPVKL